MNKTFIYVAAGLTILLLMIPGQLGGGDPFAQAVALIKKFEGFSPHPYWDVNRWSWGYGTKAPGQYGTITEAQAEAELIAHLKTDYAYLDALVDRSLSANQWAAYLSFSYNLGRYNADNLIENINSGNQTALGAQWNAYVNSGGAVNPTLVDRRKKEWALWQQS